MAGQDQAGQDEAPTALPKKAAASKTVRKKPSGVIRDLQVGERCIAIFKKETQVGTVRYMGKTDFAEGEWVGIELDEEAGKNDGSVNGSRYFTCPANLGIFHRFDKVRRFDEYDKVKAEMAKRRSRTDSEVAVKLIDVEETSSQVATPVVAQVAPVSPPSSPSSKKTESPRKNRGSKTGEDMASSVATDQRLRYEASKRQHQQLMACAEAVTRLRETIETVAEKASSVNEALSEYEAEAPVRQSKLGASAKGDADADESASVADSQQRLVRARAMQVAQRLQESVCSILEKQVANTVGAAVEAGTRDFIEAAAQQQALVMTAAKKPEVSAYRAAAPPAAASASLLEASTPGGMSPGSPRFF